ncbi:hypothetical protein KPP03845_104736 [Streptomyces xanthophaeus]|uniref:hypothetical protein n=1 Tax=Streptomyces xanthophaeus TaxID=67385 RepID=UPI00233E756B|nr:hypothetical protein [Streptomyces xanthophaeus]WCD88330.1 hypothetical protein KPP03845_104736 [Streptomyces xanthophaeus]
MNRQQRCALFAPCVVSALVLTPATAATAAGSGAPARAPAAVCALVKGEPAADGKATFDLKLSGFRGGARVTISGPELKADARVASNGRYVDENVKHGDYTVRERNRNAPAVTCSKVAAEPDKPPASKTADVTAATATQQTKTGKVPCVIFSPELPVKFTGTITSATAGDVKYRWTLSNGKVSGVLTLNFTQPGTQNVPVHEWGATGLVAKGDQLSGWGQISIIGDDTKSNRAEFSITCVTPGEP